MECQIWTGHHALSRKLKKVPPEKPKTCLKTPRVSMQSHDIAFEDTIMRQWIQALEIYRSVGRLSLVYGLGYKLV